MLNCVVFPRLKFKLIKFSSSEHGARHIESLEEQLHSHKTSSILG